MAKKISPKRTRNGASRTTKETREKAGVVLAQLAQQFGRGNRGQQAQEQCREVLKHLLGLEQRRYGPTDGIRPAILRPEETMEEVAQLLLQAEATIRWDDVEDLMEGCRISRAEAVRLLKES